MAFSHWRLSGGLASLHCGSWQGRVDVDCPRAGLHGLARDGRTYDGLSALAVEIDTAANPLTDAYVRAADLIATYEATPSQPHRLQVYWRVQQSDGLLAVDLYVSVQTQRLDVQSSVATSSVVPADEVLRLVDARSGRFEAVVLDDRRRQDIARGDGPGCLVFRLRGDAVSYAEMAHPVDFQGSELCRSGEGGAYRLRHNLFAAHLEKGVILRARQRGVLLAREDDLAGAAAQYASFVAAELPLTT